MSSPLPKSDPSTSQSQRLTYFLCDPFLTFSEAVKLAGVTPAPATPQPPGDEPAVVKELVAA